MAGGKFGYKSMNRLRKVNIADVELHDSSQQMLAETNMRIPAFCFLWPFPLAFRRQKQLLRTDYLQITLTRSSLPSTEVSRLPLSSDVFELPRPADLCRLVKAQFYIRPFILLLQ